MSSHDPLVDEFVDEILELKNEHIDQSSRTNITPMEKTASDLRHSLDPLVTFVTLQLWQG
jgi:hypothetical protein